MPQPRTAPANDGATALRDRRLAEYEARLNHSQARPTATIGIGEERSDPMAATGGGILRGVGHDTLLHPSSASRHSRLAANVTDSPSARHQQRAQSLTKTSTRPTDAVYGDVHYWERGLEHEGTVPCQQFSPRQRYQDSLETPDDVSAEMHNSNSYLSHEARALNLDHHVMVVVITVVNDVHVEIGMRCHTGLPVSVSHPWPDMRPHGTLMVPMFLPMPTP